MNRKVWAIAFCALVMSPTPSAALDAPPASKNAVIIQSAMRQLERFHETHSLSDLQAAAGTMGSSVDIDSLQRKLFVQERRAFLRGMVRVLKAIQESFDPTYDPRAPANIPRIGCLEAPTTPPVPICAPTDIKTEEVRVAYAAAVQANEQKLERSRAYGDLVSVDSLAMAILDVHLVQLRRIAPCEAPSDISALEEIVRRAGLAPERQRTIDAMLEEKPRGHIDIWR